MPDGMQGTTVRYLGSPSTEPNTLACKKNYKNIVGFSSVLHFWGCLQRLQSLKPHPGVVKLPTCAPFGDLQYLKIHHLFTDRTLIMLEPLREAESYKYNRLPTGYIRLLELETGDSSTSLTANFLQTDSINPCSYTALSYVWGSEPAVNIIILNQSSVLPVRPNLHRALCALRQEDTSMIFWADTICINQADIKERNSQIRLMTDIYRNACEVMA